MCREVRKKFTPGNCPQKQNEGPIEGVKGTHITYDLLGQAHPFD